MLKIYIFFHIFPHLSIFCDFLQIFATFYKFLRLFTTFYDFLRLFSEHFVCKKKSANALEEAIGGIWRDLEGFYLFFFYLLLKPYIFDIPKFSFGKRELAKIAKKT